MGDGRGPVLGIGVIGVGDVAQRDYLPEFGRLREKARLIAVSSRTQQRARSVAEEFGADRWTTDWREVLTADVDLILNLTPIGAHGEITRAALEAGKHVYSEKPLAATPAQGQELAELAEKQGCTLVAGPSVALFPQVVDASRFMAAGRLGKVHSFRSQVYAGVPPWAGYDGDPHPFFAADGGPLRDMGVYPLHALTALLGPVVSVSAMSRRTRTSFTPNEGPFAGVSIPVEADDDWALLMRTRSGAMGVVQVNFCAREAAAPELELQGELGTVALSLLDVAQPLRVLTADSAEWGEVPVRSPRSGGPDHLVGVEHLIECVVRDRAPLLSAEHAIHVLDVLAAAESASHSGRTVEVTSDFGWNNPVDKEDKEGRS